MIASDLRSLPAGSSPPMWLRRKVMSVLCLTTVYRHIALHAANSKSYRISYFMVIMTLSAVNNRINSWNETQMGVRLIPRLTGGVSDQVLVQFPRSKIQFPNSQRFEWWRNPGMGVKYYPDSSVSAIPYNWWYGHRYHFVLAFDLHSSVSFNFSRIHSWYDHWFILYELISQSRYQSIWISPRGCRSHTITNSHRAWRKQLRN